MPEATEVKRVFLTRYDILNKRNKGKYITCPGERFRIDYVKKFDDKGNEYLEECGKTDLQAVYDSKLEMTDLHLIINNLLENGINPFSSTLEEIEDDVVDLSQLRGLNTSEMLLASQNYSKNVSLIQEYEAKIAALKGENSKIQNKHDDKSEKTEVNE